MESRVEVNGKRRAMENGTALGVSAKRIKGLNYCEDVKNVAEIVLILAAMGKMRGSKRPSDVERELMDAARCKLADFCEGFAPKDLFPLERFGGMIDDLGLDRLKDQNLGVRVPKISIAEKLLASMKKMEKADEFALTSMHTSRLPGNSAHPVGVQTGGTNSNRTQSSDVPMNASRSSGSLQFGHGNAATLSYQLPTSEIRPITSSGTAVPRVDRPHIGSDGRLNVSANYSARVPQGANEIQQFSLRNAHVGIVKIVQRLLQPRNTEIPTWDPPSRDYMSKALTCPLCTLTATDVESILICDACETGFHYAKCLWMKDVPKVEWHCANCMSLSNGMPLPPKYGRVMKDSDTEKSPSNSDSVPANSIIKTGALINGSIMPGKGAACAGNIGHQISRSLVNETAGMLETSNTSLGTCSSSLIKAPVPDARFCNLVTSIANGFETIPAKESHENQDKVMDSKESHFTESFGSIDQVKADEIVPKISSGIYSSEGNVNKGRCSVNVIIPAVKWIDDPIHVSEEKCFYGSCFINGHPYKVSDHALVRFDSGKLLPAKIQVLWEDKITSTEYVTVNRCYFPDDLPQSIGRPCGLENNEVCESTSNHDCLAASIEGPCLVFAPRRFAQESERRAHSVETLNDHLPPLYLCKWIYDETKELFRDASF